ncbi:MAG TPA: c-type cytochrome [Longimicrobium sp.]|nr:c-type cytochrome [Longimicrobium sp.]
MSTRRERVWCVRSRWTAAATAAALAALAGCGGGHVPLPALAPSDVGDTTGLVARGEYIVRTVAVCGHCHGGDPRNPDGALSGGMAFRNWRLGTIRASNLTPDPETGLGRWSDAEIVRAIRSGEDREGHVLAPVMPYAWLRGMSERDALAIARYLRTLPPVRNEVHNSPNLVFRAAKLFVLSPTKPTAIRAPRPAPDAEYGRYLANHVSFCGDCHTPRGGLQASADLDRLYAGDPSPEGFPANPSNLTPDEETGIGRWTEEDFFRAMRTGVRPQGDTLHPFMPWRELGMTDDDLRAIYRYLRTLPPIRNHVPRRPRTPAAGG